jgi:O-antigen ligase
VPTTAAALARAPADRRALVARWATHAARAGVLLAATALSFSLAATQIGLLVALLGLVARRASGHRAWSRSPLDLPALLAAGAAVLSLALAAAAGVAPASALGELRWRALLMPILVLSALEASLPGEDPAAPRRRALALVAAWAAGACLPSALAWVQSANGFDLLHALGLRAEPVLAPAPRWEGRYAAVGLFRWYVYLAHNLLPPLALAAALALAAPLRRAARALLGTAALAAAAAVALTTSRAAWAALAVAVAVVLALSGGRLARRGLPLALAAFLAASLAHPGLRARLTHAFAAGENADRATLWAICADVARDHPLVGTGYARFTPVAEAYFDRRFPGALIRTGCHDTPFTLLVEGGPLLLAAFAAAFALAVRAFVRWRRTADALGRAAAAGALAALAGTLVNGLFHDVHLESHAMLALGVTLAAAAALARPRYAGGL